MRWLSAAGLTATALSLIHLYLDITGRIGDITDTHNVVIDTALCAVMMTEWGVLFWLCTDRKGFFKRRWIDGLASLPLLLVLRPFRAVRVVRLLRLIRAGALLTRVMRPWQRTLDCPMLRSTSAMIFAIICLGALMIMDIERDNPALDEYGEALWWAIVTATTVGYGDIVPQSAEGRMLAVGLMVVGIAFFGTLAASITNTMASAHAEVSIDDVMHRLDRLDAMLQRLSDQAGEGEDTSGQDDTVTSQAAPGTDASATDPPATETNTERDATRRRAA